MFGIRRPVDALDVVKWREHAEALQNASVFGTILTVAACFIPHWVFIGGPIDRNPWYVVLPSTYAGLSLFGYLIYWAARSDRDLLRIRRLAEAADLIYQRINEEGLLLLAQQYRERALLWNPIVWPFRFLYKLIRFLRVALRRNPAFKPMVWQRKPETVFAWWWRKHILKRQP